jgi:hypothetical protein
VPGDLPGGSMIDVTMPIDLPSANAILRMHWRKQRQLRTEYRNWLWARARCVSHPPEGKQRVTITRILGPRQREFDPDNLPASCKSLIDALRDCKHIGNDTGRDIELVLLEDSANRAAGPAVRVRVEAAEC